MTPEKIHPTTFRFNSLSKDALKLIADRDGRSMANMLEWLIRKHCEDEALGWPPKLRKGKADAHGAARASANSTSFRPRKRL